MAKKTYDTSDLSKPGYYVVNPAGAVHECTRDHAQKRLKQVGWRLATPDEVEKFHEVHKRVMRKTRVKGEVVERSMAGPGQKAGNPLAEPYSDDPDEILKDRAEKALAEAETGSEPSEKVDGADEQDHSAKEPESKPEPPKEPDVKPKGKSKKEKSPEIEAEASSIVISGGEAGTESGEKAEA